MQSRVPVRPLAAGKLGSLLGGEQDESFVGLSRCFEGRKYLTDLTIHVSDLGEITAEVLTRPGRVGNVGRQVYLVRSILGGITHCPGDVRFNESHHEAEGILGFREESTKRRDVVRAGWIANAIWVKAGDFAEREGIFGFHVHFSRKAHSVS